MRDLDVKINRFITRPVLFLGLPLKLMFISIAFIVIGLIATIMIASIGGVVTAVIGIVIGAAIAFGGRHMVKMFYVKYGEHGFKKMLYERNSVKLVRNNADIAFILKQKKGK